VDDVMPALLVTGAPGAGKTALAHEIGEQLFHAKEAHAVIDLDELARMRPAVPDEAAWGDLVVENLRAVWPNYRALGIRRVVLAGIVRSAATVEAYRSAIPGAELAIVRVRAAHETLHARLRHREPGTKRTFLLDVAAQLDGQIAGLGVEDFAVDNHPGEDVADLARTILERLGWPMPVV
jgi:dephospho-CoA kinase